MKNLFLSLFLFASFLTFAQDAVRDVETNIIPNVVVREKTDFVPDYFPGDVATLLYNNGPAYNVAGGGAGGANLSLLESTTLGMNTLGFGHQFSLGYRMADEFTVPSGETWTIDSLIFYAYQTNSTLVSTITGVYFQIWNGDPSVGGSAVIYGDLTTNRLANTYWSGIYRASETTPTSTARPMMRDVCSAPGLVLTEGTYWIDWTTNGSLSSGPWAPPIAILGQAATGNALQYTTAWAPALDGGTGAAPQGMPFEVWGTASGSTMGVMLVQDNTTGTDSVEAWLNLCGTTYTRVTNTTAIGMPTSDWLNNYDAVLWIGTTSTGAEADSCTAYLAHGGNLLAMDNDEGYFVGASPLFQNYLMSLYQTDAGSDGVITGLDMMAGLSQNISADPYPDDVLPNTGPYGTGVPIFLSTVTGNTYAGMRGPGGFFRSQLLCWDPQYGADRATNIAIICRSVDWLVDGIVPVELTSFSSSVTGTDVTLSWITATEINNLGFEVERNSGNGFVEIGFVPGFGTTTETRTYSFTDAGLKEGVYSYRLKQIDYSGISEYSQIVEVEIIVPDVYALEQNYPNPFNPGTTISYSLAADSKVLLTVFNLLGEEVATLVNGNVAAGGHTIEFSADNLNSGVYFYRIDAQGVNGSNFTSVKKMILNK
jgi:hypothetical protein